ncbi:ABC transporter ATP-binding protein [Streptomyces sp. ST2-7A]|uniref:ATP-binding cassette domain-containing protein n=1 Tax=Streptomyces sp. ST2-7A TaxID=2907214 RepID=UPI002279E4BF
MGAVVEDRPRGTGKRGEPATRPGRGLFGAGLRFLRRRPGAVAALTLWSLPEAARTLLLGYGVARALDDGFLAGEPAVGLLWLSVAAAGVVVGAIGTWRVHRAVAALVEPLRDLLVRRVTDRALAEAVRAGRPGDTSVVSRLTHQTEIARDGFAGLVLITQMFVFTSVGAVVGLLWLDPLLLVVVVPPLVTGLVLFGWSLGPLARRQAAHLVAEEEWSRSLGATVVGLRDVVAAGAEERVRAGEERRVAAAERSGRALARWTVTRPLAMAVGGWGPVVVLLLAAPALLDRGLTAGALVGALTYLTQSLIPALETLVRGVGGAGARLVVVVGRLRAATGPLPPLPASRPVPGPGPGPGAPAVEMRGVCFGYGGVGSPVLTDLDLVVPRGGRVAVMGPSGVGKSTLAAVLSGLVPPDAGRVALCGVPLAGPGTDGLAGLRTLVPQESYVFSGSVRENLLYHRPGPPPPDAVVVGAAREVGAGELVERLGGPDGPVAPAALSAGERQLLALARAHLSPAPVLVLDEATCHLDPAAEARAENALADVTGRTLVVIAHRPGSARRADRVLMLDGTHADLGTHAELVGRCPGYRESVAGWSDPTGLAGDADGVDAIPGAGLAGDGGDVVADGAPGEVEVGRDLGRGAAVGDQ